MTAWPLILGMGGAAVAAGTLVVPAARRVAFGSLPQDWLGNELDLDRIEKDGITVRCKTRTVMRAYRLGGTPYDTKPETEQTAFKKARAEFLHFAAVRKAVIRLHGVKRLKSTIYPATWPSRTLQEIGDAEAALFREAFEVRWYMTLQTQHLYQVAEVDERTMSALKSYKVQRLARPDDPDKPCPLTGFLNFLNCGEVRDDLRAVSSNVSANLPGSDLVFDKTTGEMFAHQPTPMHYRTIAVRLWPDQVAGTLLHDIMALPGEIEVTQVLVPISKEKALFELKRRANTPMTAARVAEESNAAIQLLQEGNNSRFVTQMAVILRARSTDALDTLTKGVTDILSNAGVDYATETKAAPTVWFNRLPDREKLARPLKLFDDNVAALWPFENAPTGLTASQYGPAPVRSFRTGSGQSYAFQFQNSPKPKSLGHYCLFAPSNSGKTTLMMHLLSGLARFEGVRSYVFDSQEGCRFMVEAMGGRYLSFDNLALNPLDVPDTRRNRHRLRLLVRLMLGEAAQGEEVEDILRRAADIAFQLPREQRSFNEIFRLSFEKQTAAHKAFSQWVEDHKGRRGPHAHIFNAPSDSLGGLLDQSFLTAINMNDVLDDVTLAAPVVAHIGNGIERVARSGSLRGFNLFVDEAANLVRNPEFREFVKVAYREYRKLGGCVGLAFQEPKALISSGILEEVLANTATFGFYPSPNSSREHYAPFGLNDEQWSFISSAPEGRKILLVKRDASTGLNESVILDIDLDPLGAAKRFYDSGPDAVLRLQAIQEQWGDEWHAHV
jgi:type IV secretion system protein VirB4